VKFNLLEGLLPPQNPFGPQADCSLTTLENKSLEFQFVKFCLESSFGPPAMKVHPKAPQIQALSPKVLKVEKVGNKTVMRRF